MKNQVHCSVVRTKTILISHSRWTPEGSLSKYQLMLTESYLDVQRKALFLFYLLVSRKIFCKDKRKFTSKKPN